MRSMLVLLFLFLPIFGVFGNTLLMDAIELGSYEDVVKLVTEGADVFYRNWNGKHNITPLSQAVKRNDVRIMKFLLEKKRAIKDDFDGYRLDPLILAVQLNRIEMAKLLLAFGTVPDFESYGIRDTSQTTPLIEAACLSNAKMVQLLLQYKANPNFGVNALNTKRIAPLHVAGDTNVAGLLLQHRGNIDLKSENDHMKITPVFSAIMSGNTDLAILLIQKGCALYATAYCLGYDSLSSVTPLMYAIRYNNHAVVKEILKRGVNLNHVFTFLRNNEQVNFTALGFAKSLGYTNIAQIIQEHGGVE